MNTLLEIIANNTSSYTRHRLYMCGKAIGARCIEISIEKNIAIVIDKSMHVCDKFMLIPVKWNDNRRDAVVKSYAERFTISNVHLQDYHLTAMVRPSLNMTYQLCKFGEYDVIKLALDKFAEDDYHNYQSVVCLIHRGFDDLALEFLEKCRDHRDRSDMYLYARMAAELCSNGVLVKTLKDMVGTYWLTSLEDKLAVLVACMRGEEVSVVTCERYTTQCDVVIAAVCGGGPAIAMFGAMNLSMSVLLVARGLYMTGAMTIDTMEKILLCTVHGDVT